MFERSSVRVMAGALLWSTALILLSLAFHGRLYGVQQGMEDLVYVRSMISCTVIGSFFGVFFGALANIPRHPLWINAGAGFVFAVGILMAPIFAKISVIGLLPQWANGLIVFYLVGILGAILGGLLTPTLKKLVPFGTNNK